MNHFCWARRREENIFDDLNFVGYSLGPRQPYEQLQLLTAYIHQLLAFSLSLTLPCSLLCLLAIAGPRLWLCSCPIEARRDESWQWQREKQLGQAGPAWARPPAPAGPCVPVLLSTGDCTAGFKILITLRTTLASLHTPLSVIFAVVRHNQLRTNWNVRLTSCESLKTRL